MPVLSSSGFQPVVFFLIWRPPALPHRLQCSTIGRLGLNRRVRDGNGCFPQAHRYQKCCYSIVLDNSTVKHIQYSTFSSVLVGLIQPFSQPTWSISLERRWSSRTFRYGYLVTTSPQLPAPPSTAPSIKVGSLASGISDSHGVTGGVYKTRERIHRDILIRDY